MSTDNLEDPNRRYSFILDHETYKHILIPYLLPLSSPNIDIEVKSLQSLAMKPVWEEYRNREQEARDLFDDNIAETVPIDSDFSTNSKVYAVLASTTGAEALRKMDEFVRPAKEKYDELRKTERMEVTLIYHTRGNPSL